MQLNHTQKNYIKKYIKEQTIDELCQNLNLSKETIISYLSKKWGQEKLNAYLAKNTLAVKVETESNLNVKDFLKNHWLNLMVITILIILTYSNALTNAFLSDDLAEIARNPRVGDFSYIFSHPFGFIRLLLNYFAFHLGRLNPIFFRLINYGFHLGSALILYIILTRLANKKVALFAAAIFAVHPGFAEAVVWISGGTYPQYAFFFLLSFLLYILSKNNIRIYLISVVVFSFAFMSHPVMPLSLFLVFLVYEYAFGDIKRNWKKSLPFLGLSIAYVFINLSVLPEREITLQSVHYQESGIDNPLLLIPTAVSSYMELLFFPKILTLYHSELAFNSFGFLLRVILTGLILAGTIFSFKKNRVIFFWLSLFWLSLSPTLTPFRLNWIVAERYLYLPSLGIIIPFAMLLDYFSENKKLKYFIYTFLTLIIILLSVRTIIRNIDWKNEDSLWIATGQTSPSSPNNHNNLGDVYGRLGDKQRALQEFQTAILLKPNYGDAYHNLANTYRELGQLDKALENYQKATQINPKLWQSYQNMAAIYFSVKEYDKALDSINQAIKINPTNINLRNNLGMIYLGKGEKDKAKEIFSLVLAADGQNQMAQAGLIEASK